MFIDSVVKAFVPNPIEKSELFHLVTIYQNQNLVGNTRMKGAAIILEIFSLITL